MRLFSGSACVCVMLLVGSRVQADPPPTDATPKTPPAADATPATSPAPVAVTTAATPAEALHLRIDKLVGVGTPAFLKDAALRAGDEEFLRRVSLDLIGRIPSSQEAREFLKDESADKRVKLVDKLLASPEFASHFTFVFDVLLMERRPSKHVTQGDWHKWLRDSLAANVPLDVLLREILTADGVDPQTRPAAKFMLDRNVEVTTVTRDLGRFFLGKNIQCSQCHDHPVVDDYKQDHFYGLQAFLNRTYLFTDAKKVAMLAEKADGEVSFQSVFDPKKVTKTTGPKLLDGPPIDEPKLEKGKEYEVAPAKDVRPVPKFSRRAQLGEALASDKNQLFARSFANRLWSMMFGRGIVHPLDFDHSDNPPSHPELLDMLSKDLAAMKYDIRAYLRELALSETYQRSSARPAGAAALPEESLLVSRVRALSPEQLGLSTLQATGQLEVEQKALGAKNTPEALHNRLTAALGPFVTHFSGIPGEPDSFSPSTDQVLFVRNGEQVRVWIAAGPGKLTERLFKLEKPEELAEELFLSLYTRRPTAEEVVTVTEFVKSFEKERAQAIQELVWACLAAAEFRFNH